MRAPRCELGRYVALQPSSGEFLSRTAMRAAEAEAAARAEIEADAGHADAAASASGGDDGDGCSGFEFAAFTRDGPEVVVAAGRCAEEADAIADMARQCCEVTVKVTATPRALFRRQPLDTRASSLFLSLPPHHTPLLSHSNSLRNSLSLPAGCSCSLACR